MDKNWTPEQWKRHYELVKRGKILHLLHPKQKEVIDFIITNPKIEDIAIYSSRKMGKTMMLTIYGYWFAANNPNITVRHVLPTLKNAKDVVIPVMEELLAFIPKEFQPTFYASTGTWKFNNGSCYILNGAHRDSLDSARGPATSLLLFDESAFYDEGSYDFAMNSVFLPQQTLVKEAKRIFATTPPVSPKHPFITKTLPLIQANGAFFHFTIFDSPLMTPERIEQIKQRLGETSNAWRREYMAELIVDDGMRVIPEFDKAKHVTDELPPSQDVFGMEPHYCGYQVADYGVGRKDLAGILAGTFDHNKQILYITAETLMKSPTLTPFADAWFELLNSSNFKDCDQMVKVVDAFESVKHTLRGEHGMTFLHPKKGKVVDMVMFLRTCFKNDKIRVTGNCPKLITQLSLGIWKDSAKDEFSRSDEEDLGHLDLLACLIYMIRQVDWKYRPGVSNKNIQLGNKPKDKLNVTKAYFRGLR